MRLKGLTFLLCILPLLSEAQSAFTLKECIDYALENNDQLKIQAYEKDIAKGTIGETTALGLPQVNATAGFQDNLEIQTSFIQDFISPATYSILFDEGLLEERDLGPPASFPAQFGTPVTGNAGISVSQLIFNGSYFVGLQAARALRELTDTEYIKTEIDVIDAVSKAYYLVLVSQENLELLSTNYNRLNKLYQETSAMYESGFVEKIEVSRLKVQVNNLRSSLSSATELLKVSLAALKLQMGMSPDDTLELTETLDNITLDLEKIPATKVDPENRIEYNIMQQNRNLAMLDIKNNKVQYLPNIYASFNLGWTSGVNTFGDLWQFNDQTWFRYTSWGVSLNIPIFDGFEKKYKIQQAKYKLGQTELGLTQLSKSFKVEEINARTALQNALTEYKINQENVELAEEIFQVAEIKYQEGVGSNLEVVDADSELKTAQTNYLNSLYNALVAKIDLLKALGILNK